MLEDRRAPLHASELAAAVYPESRALVHAHRRRGHTVAVVSSATRYQIEPLARDLGIEHVLCTRLEVARRALHRRRRRSRPATARARRSRRARFARRRAASTSRESFFYTDSDEDLPLLEHRRPAAADQPEPRGSPPSPRGAAGRRGASPAAARPASMRRRAHVAGGRQPRAVVPARRAGGAAGRAAGGR